jgi:hypothetical protein
VENKEEAVVYGSDVDELERKENTDQIKAIAEEVFKTMLAAAVRTNNYTLWSEQVFDIRTPSIHATTAGQLVTTQSDYTLPTVDGFSPAAIRASYALPRPQYNTKQIAYYYGVYMYGYTARIFYGTDQTDYCSVSVRLIVTYIRNNIDIPTITIPQ